MKQHIKAKHSQKKSLSEANLFDKNFSEFHVGPISTAAQLHPLLLLGADPHQTDAALRRIELATNPATGLPWIPKAAAGRRLTVATIAGVSAWREHRAQRPALPVFASMELAETVGQIPRKIQKLMIERGVNFKRANNNIDFASLLAGVNTHILTPLANSDRSKLAGLGLGGLDYLDGDHERTLLVRAQRIKTETDTEDTLATMRARVEAILQEQLLSPLRADLINLDKTINRQIDELLRATDLAAPLRAQLKQIVTSAKTNLFRKIQGMNAGAFQSNHEKNT